MYEFTLIDLYSQRAAAMAYAEGSAIEDVLNWVRCYGKVDEVHGSYQSKPYYHFRSFVGLTCWFYFDDQSNLTVETSGWFYS
jgi:hypothetical protein